MLDSLLELFVIVISDAFVLLKWIIIAVSVVVGPAVIIGGIVFLVDCIRGDFGKYETEKADDPGEMEYQPWIAEER